MRAGWERRKLDPAFGSFVWENSESDGAEVRRSWRWCQCLCWCCAGAVSLHPREWVSGARTKKAREKRLARYLQQTMGVNGESKL